MYRSSSQNEGPADASGHLVRALKIAKLVDFWVDCGFYIVDTCTYYSDMWGYRLWTNLEAEGHVLSINVYTQEIKCIGEVKPRNATAWTNINSCYRYVWRHLLIGDLEVQIEDVFLHHLGRSAKQPLCKPCVVNWVYIYIIIYIYVHAYNIIVNNRYVFLILGVTLFRVSNAKRQSWESPKCYQKSQK